MAALLLLPRLKAGWSSYAGVPTSSPPLRPAVVGIEGRDATSREGLGDFYRPLAPGRYFVEVSKPGFKPFTTNITVPADGSGAQRHFVLAPEGSSSDSAMAFGLRSLGRGELRDGSGAHLAAAAGDGGVGPGGGMMFEAGSHLRNHLGMLTLGGVVVWGLWHTHQRLQRRSHQRKA